MIGSARIAFAIGLLLLSCPLRGDDQYRPEDPIAAVNGDPIYVGELNLVLIERLGLKQLDDTTIELQQAAALLLVRRHLAMKSLKTLGQDALQAVIQQRLDAMVEGLRRTDSSLAKYSAARMSDEKSLLADLSWKVAWGQYIKSKLTEANLRRYFEANRERYAETVEQDFDDLTDQAALRRDATSAMFDSLVRKQQDAEVEWFIPALRPPDGVTVIP